MNRKLYRLVAAAFLATAGFHFSAWAQSAGGSADALDCVMEPRSTIELASPEEGILDELMVERGDVIKQGDVVAKLDTRLERLGVELAGLRAKSDVDIRSGKAQLDFRGKEVARLTELQRQNMASRRDYDTAEIEQRLAELALEKAQFEHRIARVEHERAKARLERYYIRSPVDGVVVEVTMSPGEYAYEQSPVMTIAEIHPLNVEVFVPVSRYGQISVGMPAEVRPREPVGGVHPARVSVVDRVFDAASGTFGVRLELPNPDFTLPAGLRCEVRFLGNGAMPSSSADADLNLSVESASPSN